MKKVYFLEDLHPSEEFNLLAIHSDAADYQIAFQINQTVGAQFKRSKKDIDLQNEKAFYSRFEWTDPKTDCHYDLFSNKYRSISSNNLGKKITLFDQPLVKEVYLLPEYRRVNYFIKTKYLEELSELKNKLKPLSSIALLYLLTPSKIDNHNNLIFD